MIFNVTKCSRDGEVTDGNMANAYFTLGIGGN